MLQNKKHEFYYNKKILLFGSPKVGKTTLISLLNNKPFITDYFPTNEGTFHFNIIPFRHKTLPCPNLHSFQKHKPPFRFPRNQTSSRSPFIYINSS